MKLIIMFDCGNHKLDYRMFKEYDWFDFYRNAKDNIMPNITERRGKYVTVSIFLMQDMVGIKYIDVVRQAY